MQPGSETGSFWLCPSCKKHVPSRQDSCRCGFKRSASQEPVEELSTHRAPEPSVVTSPNFRLDVGGVLQRTFAIWWAGLMSFCAVGLIVYSPILLGLCAIAATRTPMPLLKSGLDLIASLFHLALSGGITYGVFQQLRGQPVGVGDLVRVGYSRLGTVWVTAFMAGVVTALGFCALVIPGLILLVRYWVAVPVAVIESPGGNASLSRSVELTAGSRWPIFGVLLVLSSIGVLSTLLLLEGLRIVGGPALFEAATEGARIVPLNAGGQALQDALLVPVSCLGAVAPAVAYHDLLVGKEGLDVDALLKVFE